MVKNKSILSGDKISSRHTTFNTVAGAIIKKLKNHPDVRKIALGPIKKAKNSSIRRFTVKEDKGQAKIMCRDSGSIQVIWVIGADVEVLEEALKDVLK